MFFLDHAWLVPLIPALSFVVILLFGKRFPKHGSEVGIVAVGASFVLSCGAAYQWINHVRDVSHGEESTLGALGRSIGRLGQESGAHDVTGGAIVHSVTWFQNVGIKLAAGIQIDGLAVMMMFVVTLISLLVHVYSIEYMRGDRRYTYFFAALSLFTASMLLLVVADNTLQLLVGWELVGVCSFMLIGHWWEEQANSDAALKAFLTTRTGDIGLLTGVIMTFFIVQRATGDGSFNIVELNDAVRRPNRARSATRSILWCALALLLGDHRQVGPVPAAHVAARRDGRPDAGLRAHPRRHDGRRRRLPRRARLPGVLARPLDRHARPRVDQLDGADRRHHGAHRSRARVRAGRHQEGARVLDDQPARLHGDGARASARGPRPCSTSSRTRSSRPTSSSAPVR